MRKMKIYTPEERLNLYLKIKSKVDEGSTVYKAAQEHGVVASTYKCWEQAMKVNGHLNKGSIMPNKLYNPKLKKKSIIQMDLPIESPIRVSNNQSTRVALFVGNYSDIKNIYTELFS